MKKFSVGIFFSYIVIIIVTVTQINANSPMIPGNNTQSYSSNIWTAKLPATNIGGFKYHDGQVILLQNQLKSSDFFFTPFPYIEPNLTTCYYNEFDDQTELKLFVSLYTPNLLEDIEKDIKKNHPDLCAKEGCKVSLLPMHSIRLFQKGRRPPDSRKRYTVDSEWQSNTQLRQTIEFIIQTSNMHVCESLKNSIKTHCSLSNFEIHYALEGQQTAARTVEVTTEHVTDTSMYNKIKSQFPSNDQGIIALTGADYKKLLSETMDQITANIRVDEGYESMQDPIDIDRMLDRQLKFNEIQLTRINDNLWDSLYWTHELTRPDQLSKILNKVIKQDTIDSDKFRFDYSQIDEASKQTLQYGDKQKLSNLEKQFASESPNATRISNIGTRFNDNIDDNILELMPENRRFHTDANTNDQEINNKNDNIIHFKVDNERNNHTNSDRKNSSAIILKRNDAKKLVRYLSENVEIEGNIIKPKPIDVTLVKFSSLKFKTRLFSSMITIKTRMNVHILPLRCPYKYRPVSSGTWLEVAHYQLSDTVDNLTNIINNEYNRLSNSIDIKYDRLLNIVNNLTKIIGGVNNHLSDAVETKYNRLFNFYNNCKNIADSKYDRLFDLVNNSTDVIRASNGKLMADLIKTIDEFKTSQNYQVKNLINTIQNNIIQQIDKNQLITNSLINQSSKYCYENIIGNRSTSKESINPAITQSLHDLEKKITSNAHALHTLMANEASELIEKYRVADDLNVLYEFARTNSILSINIVQHNPLMVKVQLINGWWFQGMVCDDNFNSSAAIAACRSDNATVRRANFLSVSWEPKNECEYGFGFGKGIPMKYKCNFILDEVTCDSDTHSSLKDCKHNDLFNHNCGNAEHVNLICS